MLLGCASNFLFDPFSIPRPIFRHSSPALCPRGWPLRVASLSSCSQASRWVWPIEGTGRRSKREERKWGRGVLLLYSLPRLGCIFWQWLNPSRAIAPVRQPLLFGSSSLFGLQEWMLFLLFAPLDLASDNSFPLLLVSGWQEPHVTLNSAHSLKITPSLKSWTIRVGLCSQPELRIQTIDL